MKLTHDELEFLSAWAREELLPTTIFRAIAFSLPTACPALNYSCLSRCGPIAKGKGTKTF